MIHTDGLPKETGVKSARGDRCGRWVKAALILNLCLFAWFPRLGYAQPDIPYFSFWVGGGIAAAALVFLIVPLARGRWTHRLLALPLMPVPLFVLWYTQHWGVW